MTHYIDKDALVAEIERRKSELQSRIAELGNFESNTLFLFQEVDLYDDILSFIDSLEVKEVDLQKEINKEWEKCNPIDEGMGCEFANISIEQFGEIAKHFFELGLKVNNEKEK